MRGASAFAAMVLALAIGCGHEAPRPAPAATGTPSDPEHAGITTPHGDHTPHHGGMVLMNGDLHYEVVFDRQGRHQVWFSNAVRDDLPASIAKDVRMQVVRPAAPAENLALRIDESGESWVANGRPVSGDNVMVKVSYDLQGEPYEIEIPFLIPAK